MSNTEGDGIEEVKQTACDILLDHRLSQKAKNPKKAESILNRVYVATPKKNDKKSRPSYIPASVTDEVARPEGMKTALEMQVENGGAGVWSYPYQEQFQLEDDDWKYDNAPTFMGGHNVADFYDPDIEEKLNELEKEEEYLKKLEDAEVPDMPSEIEQLMEEEYGRVKKRIGYIRHTKITQKEHRVHKTVKNSDETEMKLKKQVGDKAGEIVERNIKNRRTLFDVMGVSKKRRKLGEDNEVDEEAPMEVDTTENQNLRNKMRDRKIKFALSRAEGADPKKFSSKVQDKSMERVRHQIEKKLKKVDNVNFADRTQVTKMPKHLYSGKRGNGKTDRR